eukprot:1157955-Pelagomonas_calceolata.AAC.2
MFAREVPRRASPPLSPPAPGQLPKAASPSIPPAADSPVPPAIPSRCVCVCVCVCVRVPPADSPVPPAVPSRRSHPQSYKANLIADAWVCELRTIVGCTASWNADVTGQDGSVFQMLCKQL